MKRVTGRTLATVIVLALLTGLIGAVASAKTPASPALAPSQAYTWKNVVTGAGGGYVPGIIFNETQANLIYARTDVGGAYRWDEAGQSWTQLLAWVPHDRWSWTGVDALATDPVDPNRLYMLVGTYTNAWSRDNGAVLRSTDKGNTFLPPVTLPFKVGSNMLGRSMGERLVVDPNNNNILFLGARSGNGLWKSTNAGQSWAQVNSFPDAGQYAVVPGDVYQGDIMGIAWITFDKTTGTPGNATQTIYVGVGDPTGTNIYRSTNGGSTWAAVPGQLTCSNTGITNGSSVTCSSGTSWTIGSTCPQHSGAGLIPHHGVISTDRFLYVSYSDRIGPYDGSIGDVYKLNLTSGAWTRISPRPSTAGGDCSNGMMDLLTGYGGISVDRQNPQRVLVSELNRWWPDVGLWLSTDGGATWSPSWDDSTWPPNFFLHYTGPDITAAPWLNFGITSPPQGEPPTGVKLGWMVGDIEIDPFNANRIMYGTGATIYGSTNFTNWVNGGKMDVRMMAKGIEETAVQGLISPPSGANLLSAMFDVYGFRHDNLDASPAKLFTTPSIGGSSIDYGETMPNFIVRTGGIDKALHPEVNRIGFSFDGGSNWFQGTEPPGVTNGGSVAAAANASRVVWSPDGAGVFFSTNNGSSWTASQGIPAGAFVASDRVNPNKFYGFVNGTFYVSTNGGANFSATVTGLPTAAKMKAVPGIEGDIWLAVYQTDDTTGNPLAADGLYHSTNSGTSFTKVASANITFAEAVGFGKAAPGQSYMAIYLFGTIDGVKGVFRSDDAGANWVQINDAQHQYGWVGRTITGDPRIYGRVYLASNGFGIIYGDPAGGGTNTPTPTRTNTPTNTRTNTPTPTGPTNTPTRTNTFTSTPTRTNTPTPTRTNTPTPTGPTNTPTRTNTFTSTPTRTNTPTITPTPSGAIRVQIMNGGTDNNQQAQFRFKVLNTGASAQSNISVRVYFTLDGAQPASKYVLEKYWDQSGVATITGPTLASGSTYFFTISFGATSLPAGGSWEFHTALHLNDWSQNFSSANDWWRSTGALPASYTDWPRLPGFVGATLVWGSTP